MDSQEFQLCGAWRSIAGFPTVNNELSKGGINEQEYFDGDVSDVRRGGAGWRCGYERGLESNGDGCCQRLLE